MLKMGISLEQVQQKMVLDGLDPTVLDPPGTPPRVTTAAPVKPQTRNLLAEIQAPKQLKPAARPEGEGKTAAVRPTPALNPQQEMAALLKQREAEKQANAMKLQAAEHKRDQALALAAEAKNKVDAAEGPAKVVALAELTTAQAHLSKAEEELEAVKEAQKPKRREVKQQPPKQPSQQQLIMQNRRRAIAGDDAEEAPAAAAAAARTAQPTQDDMLARAAAAAPPPEQVEPFEGGAYKKLQRKHKKYARYVTRLYQGKMSPSRFHKKVAKLYR
jgi:hypothetical protein